MPKISKKQQLINLARKNTIIRAADLTGLDLPRTYLFQLYREGILARVGRGVYQWPEADISSNYSLAELVAQVPGAVVVLLSALAYHDLTSQHPYEAWLAIDRKAWRPKIDYPPVRFVTMSKPLLEEGVASHTIDGVVVRVTSPARTIVDCFKYRNKIGLDVALEALREGWREKRFTMDELIRHAENCRVKNVMRPYLECLT